MLKTSIYIFKKKKFQTKYIKKTHISTNNTQKVLKNMQNCQHNFSKHFKKYV